MFLKTLPVAFAILIGLTGIGCHPGETEEPEKEPIFSSPAECARVCQKNEPPKTCYYQFHVELYPVLGKACDIGALNSTNSLNSSSQCVTANGVQKTMVAVNRMFPGPSIQVCLRDTVIVDVINQLPGMEIAIHFQGMYQTGSQHYDGVPLLTQCPIHQGSTFRYTFIAATPGTHFWRSSSGFTSLDGVHGNLIIRVPREAYSEISSLYDKDLNEHVIIFSDWVNAPSSVLFPGNAGNNLMRNPRSILINGKGQYTDQVTGNATTTPSAVFVVQKNCRHRFRIINAFSTMCPSELTIEGHDMMVMASDGATIKPQKITSLISFPGETYDVVIHADQEPRAYWIQVRVVGGCMSAKIQQTAVLLYEGITDEPKSTKPTYDKPLPHNETLALLDVDCDDKCPDNTSPFIDDLESTGPSVDENLIKCKPDMQIYLGINFFNYPSELLFEPNTYRPFLQAPLDYQVVGLINNISLRLPSSPPLSQPDDVPPTTFCNAENIPSNCGIPCFCTHKYDIPLGSIVELILVDERGYNASSLAFNLHGNYGYLMGKGYSENPDDRITANAVHQYDSQKGLYRNYKRPILKSTMLVPKHGYVIFKFRADNPGLWILDSSVPFARAIGLGVIFNVGNRSDLPPLPPGFPTCKSYTPPIRTTPSNKH